MISFDETKSTEENFKLFGEDGEVWILLEYLKSEFNERNRLWMLHNRTTNVIAANIVIELLTTYEAKITLDCTVLYVLYETTANITLTIRTAVQ